MASAAPISLEEYRQTSYRPDREYIDGEITERNVGTWEHARLLALLSGWIGSHEWQWNCIGAISLRLAVSANRVRVPDLVVFSSGQAYDDPATTPLLIVEILTPGDTREDTAERTADYRNMGVENLWVIDLKTHTGRLGIHTASVASASVNMERLEVPGTPIHVDLLAMFARLNRPAARET